MTAPQGRVRLPTPWLLASTALGAAVLLWGLTGWSWVVPALAVGVAIVVALLARLVGVVLPREGRWIRERAGVFAACGALIGLLAQSSPWAVLLTLGLAGVALALSQPPRVRWIALVVGGALVVAGGAGLAVQAAVERAQRDAEYRAAGDLYRAQQLPDDPLSALSDLMRLVAEREPHAACLMFNDQGARAIADAWRVADCPAAIGRARELVADVELYPELERATVTTQPAAGGGIEVDGCTALWRRDSLTQLLYDSRAPRPEPGKPLGMLTVAPSDYGIGWTITDYRRCPT